MSELTLELKTAMSELKTAIANAAPKATVEKLQAQVDAIDIKLATKHGNYSQEPTFVEKLKSERRLPAASSRPTGRRHPHLRRGKDAREILQRKTTVDSERAGLPDHRCPAD